MIILLVLPLPAIVRARVRRTGLTCSSSWPARSGSTATTSPNPARCRWSTALDTSRAVSFTPALKYADQGRRDGRGVVHPALSARASLPQLGPLALAVSFSSCTSVGRTARSVLAGIGARTGLWPPALAHRALLLHASLVLCLSRAMSTFLLGLMLHRSPGSPLMRAMPPASRPIVTAPSARPKPKRSGDWVLVWLLVPCVGVFACASIAQSENEKGCALLRRSPITRSAIRGYCSGCSGTVPSLCTTTNEVAGGP